ncbi:hypothetical protein ABDF71_02960 [Ochrobactrum sp. WV_118_8]
MKFVKAIKMIGVMVPLTMIVSPFPAKAGEPDAILMHTGKCQMLFAAKRDMSEFCGDNVLQSIYGDGRVGFTVIVGDKGSAITFSGIRKEEDGSENVEEQSLDAFILNLNIDGVPPTQTVLEGSCSYSNPYKEPFAISCRATDEANEAYQLRFKADENGPENVPLTDKAKLLPYGSRAGMNVTMTSASGIGTAKARIGIVHTRQNAKAFCLDYSHDISPQCVNETLSENEFPKAITANCRTGTFTAANGMAYQFRGRNKKPSLDVPEYRISELKSKKLLPDIGASSYDVAVSSLERLCPNLL